MSLDASFQNENFWKIYVKGRGGILLDKNLSKIQLENQHLD